ncbi:MAG: YjjG family noncanonical pyrimidine nucleotidase [Saprospiraceae bacterium]
MADHKYTSIFFDADDTILDFRRSATVALQQTLEEHELPVTEESLEIYHRINHDVWLAFERKEITAPELRLLRFERFLDAIGEYREPELLSRRYLHLLSQSCIFIDGATEVLDELKSRGFRLALITNGLKEVQRPRFANARMEQWFDTIVISDEIGVAKPDKRFFDHAFEQAGQPGVSESLVVGDSLQSDIQGGNSYGVDTAWFNPDNKENLSGHRPKYEVSNYRQLMSLIFGKEDQGR